MSIVLLGLDGEMSDSELSKGAVLVQIGLALGDDETFTSLLGYDEGSYFATDKGMGAHRNSVADIARAPRPAEVDDLAYDWLVARLADRGLAPDAKRLVPVGWNVGGFDLPFVAAYLPRTYSLLSRRVVDLNAFCMAYAAQGRGYEGSTPKWSGWKRLANAYAEKKLREAGYEEAFHDALYDARAALYCLEMLTGLDERAAVDTSGTKAR